MLAIMSTALAFTAGPARPIAGTFVRRAASSSSPSMFMPVPADALRAASSSITQPSHLMDVDSMALTVVMAFAAAAMLQLLLVVLSTSVGSKATEQAVAPSDSSSQLANAVKTLSGRVVPTAAAAAEREPWPAREEREAPAVEP